LLVIQIVEIMPMSNIDDDKDLVGKSLAKVQGWVEDHDYKGYEPFDGLSSWARPLAFGTIIGDRLLMQLIRQSPVNLRPLLGVRPKDSTKGRGYMAWGYLILYRATKQRDYLEKAVDCLEWLDQHKSSRFKYHAWSNHFDFSSRAGRYTKDDPIIVWTALIGHAYLEAFEITQEQRWLEIANSVCGWIMNLPREKTSSGDCISYLAEVQSSIHNSNMLGAAMLARTARHNGNAEYFRVARSAMEYSCTRQSLDGGWRYGEDPRYHWFDNFHTGYNLDCLLSYIKSSGDETWRDNLKRGLEFYKNNFFEDDGCPKYYHNRKYPVDSQCAAQSIDTLALLSEIDASCLDLSLKVARWTIANMQHRDGHFFYRQYPLMKARTPMLHWGQTTTFKGLAVLYEKLVEHSSPAKL
jgi:rhamnogalacturonyl hydrolase YesR